MALGLLVSLALASASADGCDASAMGRRVAATTLVVLNRASATHIYFDPSHLFQVQAADHTGIDRATSGGSWRATGEGVCVRTLIAPPDRFGPENCVDLRGREVGDEWRASDPRMGPLVYRLVQGRSAPPMPNP